jgi:N-acetyl-gamma-glutamyl-phosphate reductase
MSSNNERIFGNLNTLDGNKPMKFKVFVDGQEGTTGLQIFDYLARREDVELLRIPPEQRKALAARREYLNQADIAFLCLPDVASRESVSLVTNPNTCVIDASTAFRTDEHWVYGLPELAPGQRQRIREQKRIAVPGCHATAFLLLVHPLVAGGILSPEYPLSCSSLTGYSGGGKTMIATYRENQDDQLLSPRPYALSLNHKHLPEMMVRAGLAHPPIFTPIVANFYKGLAVTVPLYPEKLARPMEPAALRDSLAEYYGAESFVRVKPFGAEENMDRGFFDVQGCNDTNRVDIFVFGSSERLLLIARLDNLGKGASGAAVQNMNIHLGIPESTGLI